MRRSLVTVACLLVFPAAAAAASFTTKPYEGATFLTGAGPFRWGIVSSYPAGDELGGVSVEVNPGKELRRCLPPGLLTLSGLEEGTTYTVTITDDYSPGWLAEHGLTNGERCTADTPAGGNARSDSLTIAGSRPLPLPVNTPNPYERENAGGAEQAGVAARRELEEFEAERAREAQQRANAQTPSPLIVTPYNCVVPALAGHSLPGARRLLTLAHCRLGHVTLPARHRGTLAIARQHPSRGTKLAAGTAVSVVLAAPRR